MWLWNKSRWRVRLWMQHLVLVIFIIWRTFSRVELLDTNGVLNKWIKTIYCHSRYPFENLQKVDLFRNKNAVVYNGWKQMKFFRASFNWEQRLERPVLLWVLSNSRYYSCNRRVPYTASVDGFRTRALLNPVRLWVTLGRETSCQTGIYTPTERRKDRKAT